MGLFTRAKAAPADDDGAGREAAPAVGCVPIGQVPFRQRAKVAGRVRSLRVAPWADVPTLECTLVDETGGIAIVFLGRREVPGIRCGTTMWVEGMVGEHQGRLAILNPDYQLLAPALH